MGSSLPAGKRMHTWRRIWTSTRRVDSVTMESIWSTTPITTKFSSPARPPHPRRTRPPELRMAAAQPALCVSGPAGWQQLGSVSTGGCLLVWFGSGLFAAGQFLTSALRLTRYALICI